MADTKKQRGKKQGVDPPSRRINDTQIVNPSPPLAQARGQIGEQLAQQFLLTQGVTILANNVRWRRGEIDLIALDGETLAFIEVRLRSNHHFGGAAASITRQKQLCILQTAQWWLSRPQGRTHATRPCRFDAILLSGTNSAQLVWLRNAFDDFTS